MRRLLAIAVLAVARAEDESETDILYTTSGAPEKCGLLSAKGGLMMGTKKVGAFSSPRKKADIIIAPQDLL